MLKMVPVAGALVVVGLFAFNEKDRFVERCAAAAEPRPARAAPRKIRSEGRLMPRPGAQVSLGFEKGGVVGRVLVEEMQAVKKGDLLAEIETAESIAALDEARAHVAEAVADVKFYELEVTRFEKLRDKGAATDQERDRAVHSRDAARARKALAEATVRRLAAVVAKGRLVAPIDGVVIEKHVEPGETVPAGATLLVVTDFSRLRIEAEVDEFDVARVTKGAAATISAEGIDGVFSGTIEDVPDTVVTRRMRPHDPARPVDTRVLLVKVAVGPLPVKLGQKVDVTLSVGD